MQKNTPFYVETIDNGDPELSESKSFAHLDEAIAFALAFVLCFAKRYRDEQGADVKWDGLVTVYLRADGDDVELLRYALTK